MDKVEFAAYMRQWRKDHPGSVKATNEKAFGGDKEAKREYMRKYMREWNAKNRDRQKRNSLKSDYGMTLEQYNELFEATGGKCSICRKKFDGKRKRPNVDHCHKTNTLRGIICHTCNIAEGLLGDPESALRLYEYMKRNELFYQGNS